MSFSADGNRFSLACKPTLFQPISRETHSYHMSVQMDLFGEISSTFFSPDSGRCFLTESFRPC